MVFGRSRPPVAQGGAAASNGATTAPVAGDKMAERGARRRSRSRSRKGSLAARPPFGEWIRLYWLDLLTMAALGAVGLGIYEADPAPSRSFPINFQDGEIVYPEFAYPLRKEIVPIWLAALLAFIIPTFFFAIAQIRVRSFQDFNAAVFGLLYSLITAAVFQVFIKWLIGGLRPHFLAVCKPVIPPGTVGNGFQSIMFDRSICTGDRKQINDSLESMPSGHSTAAWAGFVFLALYLNAKLKFMADYRPAFWKMPLCFAPLLGAFLISGALTIDEFHNWYDVVAGGFIGTATALAAYRASYAAVFDFRFNHVPLPRTLSSGGGHHRRDSSAGGAGAGLGDGKFLYDAGSVAASGVSPFTRKAGWGAEAGISGAPGDAAKLGGGGAAGAAAGGLASRGDEMV